MFIETHSLVYKMLDTVKDTNQKLTEQMIIYFLNVLFYHTSCSKLKDIQVAVIYFKEKQHVYIYTREKLKLTKCLGLIYDQLLVSIHL